MKKFLFVGLLAMLMACNTTPASITISPKNLNVSAGSTATAFTATVTGFNSPSPSWILQSTATDKGSLSSTVGLSVDYTPPASLTNPITVTITTTIGVFKDSATITVNPAAGN